jgi:hypothetical protein
LSPSFLGRLRRGAPVGGERAVIGVEQIAVFLRHSLAAGLEKPRGLVGRADVLRPQTDGRRTDSNCVRAQNLRGLRPRDSAKACPSASAQLRHQLPRNLPGVFAARLAEPIEFDHVEPPLSQLDPPDERALPPQTIGQPALCEAASRVAAKWCTVTLQPSIWTIAAAGFTPQARHQAMNSTGSMRLSPTSTLCT